MSKLKLSRQELDEAFEEISSRPTKIEISLSPLMAWQIMGSLQVIACQFEQPEPIRESLKDIGHKIQSLIATTPTLKALANAGWDPDADITIDGEGTFSRSEPKVAEAPKETQPNPDGMAMILPAFRQLYAPFRLWAAILLWTEYTEYEGCLFAQLCQSLSLKGSERTDALVAAYLDVSPDTADCAHAACCGGTEPLTYFDALRAVSHELFTLAGNHVEALINSMIEGHKGDA